MYAEPMILPLDINGRVYALQDEHGKTIGTGTREVCEVLLFMIRKSSLPGASARSDAGHPQRPNVRSAVGI
jgi:hypothetical protein